MVSLCESCTFHFGRSRLRGGYLHLKGYAAVCMLGLYIQILAGCLACELIDPLNYLSFHLCFYYTTNDTATDLEIKHLPVPAVHPGRLSRNA